MKKRVNGRSVTLGGSGGVVVLLVLSMKGFGGYVPL